MRAIEHRVSVLETPEAPPPPPPLVQVEPPVGPEPCDEVACLLNNYEAQCCAKFKKQNRTSGLPERLDRAMISRGVAPVKGRIQACGDRSSAKGIVKVSVKVTPDGRVSSATAKQSPDKALEACVVVAISRARFAATDEGGSFSYPFVF
jgi:TonB family protein